MLVISKSRMQVSRQWFHKTCNLQVFNVLHAEQIGEMFCGLQVLEHKLDDECYTIKEKHTHTSFSLWILLYIQGYISKQNRRCTLQRNDICRSLKRTVFDFWLSPKYMMLIM
jgi:glutathionyl-hydroquinone reductase